MIALEQVILLALTAVGPKCDVSLPIIIVHAASLEVRRVCSTLRTLILCGYKLRKKMIFAFIVNN